MSKVHFVTGLPRSGSTLLMNILGNNPEFAVTPTSGLIDLFCNVKSIWRTNNEFKAQGLETVKPKVMNGMNGLLHGYFEDDFNKGKTHAFDKSRGWMGYTEVLEDVLHEPVKMILTVRDIRGIVASFEKLYRKRGIEYTEHSGDDFIKAQTTEGRCEILLRDSNVVGLPIVRLRDALRRPSARNILIVPYLQLVNQPDVVLKRVHEFIEAPYYNYNFKDIKQVTHEDDDIHGFKDLHKIQGDVTKGTRESFDKILNPQYLEQLGNGYADINKLSNY